MIVDVLVFCVVYAASAYPTTAKSLKFDVFAVSFDVAEFYIFR